MNKLAVLSFSLAFILAVTACTAPTANKSPTQGGKLELSEHRGIDRLLLEAGRTQPPQSTELKLDAAGIAIAGGDILLASRIIDSIESPYVSKNSTRDYSYFAAEVALANDKPLRGYPPSGGPAVSKISRLRCTEMQVRSWATEGKGLLYLAEVTSQVPGNSSTSIGSCPAEVRPENHEDYFFKRCCSYQRRRCYCRPSKALPARYEGWLSLAAMTKRFQDDPLSAS